MTESVKSLVHIFECLTETEQHDAAVEILRRTASQEYPDLDDETLARIADETFLELDAREAADGQVQSG